MTHEHAVLVDRVGAHPRERRRVDVQADRRVHPTVVDAMDVGGGEVKGVADAERARARLAADRQALLADAPADDGDGAGRGVVIVKAGVLLVDPADQPRGEVRVADQLLVDALGRIVADAVDPQLRLVGELADERLELDR